MFQILNLSPVWIIVLLSIAYVNTSKFETPIRLFGEFMGNKSNVEKKVFWNENSHDTVWKIYTGLTHTLILTEQGKAYGVGYNQAGQLGDGTTQNRLEAVQQMNGALQGKRIVQGAVNPVISNSLMIDKDGIVYGVGSNEKGQLGDGSTTGRYEPVEMKMDGVLLGKRITQVCVGIQFTLMLDSDGRVYGVGANENGQLGDGTLLNKIEPVSTKMDGALLGKTITQISVGSLHSVLLDSDGIVYSFGINHRGQLGDGSKTGRDEPVKMKMDGVLLGKRIEHIAASNDRTMMLDSDGLVYGVGENDYGQLGDGSKTERHEPVKMKTDGVLQDKQIVHISAGGFHTIMLDFKGKIYSVGLNNYGQLWDDTQVDSPIPVAGLLKGIDEITHIAAGYYHTMVMDRTKTVYGIGYNSGQLGNGNQTDTIVPVTMKMDGIQQGKRILQLSIGYSDSFLMLDSEWQVYGMGKKEIGQLGDGSTFERKEPVKMKMDGALLGKRITQIASGLQFSLLLSSEGKVYGVGSNTHGQLGDDTTIERHEPIAQIPTGTKIVEIAAGCAHSILLSSEGKAYGVGKNGFGQLLDGSVVERHVPVEVKVDGMLEGRRIVQISTGCDHTILLDSEWRVYGGGRNRLGQLGDGSITDKNEPVAMKFDGVLQRKQIIAISAGHGHTMMLDIDNVVYGVGEAYDGQLGDGSKNTSYRTEPVKTIMDGIPKEKQIIQISAGNRFTLLLDSDGNVYGMGVNKNGQLSTGDKNQYFPVLVETDFAVNFIYAGNQYSLIVMHPFLMQCGPGYYRFRSTCRICTQGYHCKNGLTLSLCRSGTYSFIGSFDCSYCPKGTASAISGASHPSTCSQCGYGYYSGDGASECQPCSPGYYADIRNAIPVPRERTFPILVKRVYHHVFLVLVVLIVTKKD